MLPLQLLRQVEDPLADLRARLTTAMRRAPRRPSLKTSALAGPVSAHVEALLLAKRYEAAAIYAQQALAAAQQDPDAAVALCKALTFLSLPWAAGRALRRARRLGAKGPEALFLQAVLADDPCEGLDLCLQALEKEPAYPEALFLAARLARVLGWVRQGQTLLRRVGPLLGASALWPVYEEVAREVGIGGLSASERS